MEGNPEWFWYKVKGSRKVDGVGQRRVPAATSSPSFARVSPVSACVHWTVFKLVRMEIRNTKVLDGFVGSEI